MLPTWIVQDIVYENAADGESMFLAFSQFTFAYPSRGVSYDQVALLKLSKLGDTWAIDYSFGIHTIEDINRESVARIAGDGFGGCYFVSKVQKFDGVAISGPVHINSKGMVTYFTGFMGNPLGFVLEHGLPYLVTGDSISVLNGDTFRPLDLEFSDAVTVTSVNQHPRYGSLFFGTSSQGHLLMGRINAGLKSVNFTEIKGLFLGTYGALQCADGSVIVANTILGHGDRYYTVTRLTGMGEIDPRWSTSFYYEGGVVSHLFNWGDGQILVLGGFRSVNGVPVDNAVALSLDGDADRSGFDNISARSHLDGRSNTTIMGMVIGGAFATEVLIRAVGPTLLKYGVRESPSEINLSIYRGSDLILRVPAGLSFTDRPQKTVELQAKIGAFPLSTRWEEPEIRTFLFPGSYTIVADAPAGQSGDVLIEVYKCR